ncbi:sigma-70 family RNA polymerase sigma factor [Clostridium sp. LP20]|uniref:sigma-70 family RNA polymerase sigma factor n=1 Tax=Clostridium sp. LP20 TaxID=3418665 RepID=UPI003EE5116C
MQFSIKKIKFKKELSIEELAVKGDKEAFVKLINENRLSLYRVAKGILFDDDRVDEAIQSAIVKGYESIYRLKEPQYFKTWIIRILINECNGIIRKDKKLVYIQEKFDEGRYEDKYENIDLTRAINSLEEELREVIALYYFEDIPKKEIAQILKLNDSTIRTRLFRARSKLYELLNEEGGK